MKRAVWIAMAAVTLAGCFESSTSSPDGAVPPRDAGPWVDAWDPPPPPPPTRDVDWLFVVDNSNSMTEEQASLTFEMPRIVRTLTSGDLDDDGVPDFTPVESLQMGVVSTDMGVGGYVVPTCVRADFGDDGILRTQGGADTLGCMATYPSFLSYRSGSDPDGIAQDVSCLVAGLGTGGCGYEQQLEAALKALSPAAPAVWTAPGYTAPMFYRNTYGHGDSQNAGFIRNDSMLVVVILTDEEDCSARDPDLYNPSSETYGDLALRCWAHADTALHPISRYIDGLLQLRVHPSRLVYVPVAGVPIDLVPTVDPTTGDPAPIDWDRLIGPADGTRDERMVERIDPASPNRLLPSCNVPGRGLAFPPIRMLQVARELEARGAHVGVESICQESFASIVRTVAAQLGE